MTGAPTVPEPRLSVRVPLAVKTAVGNAVSGLKARGLRASENELVLFIVETGLTEDLDVLEDRLRAWRTAKEAANG